MKLINADEAFRVLSDYYHHKTEVQHDALREALDRVPEAVVRCKDCKYCDFRAGTLLFEEMFQYYCTRFKPFKRRSDDFCSYGERRTDE